MSNEKPLDTLSIEAVVDAQRDLGDTDTHLVHIGREGYTIAHTDDERASIDLHDCPLGEWLEKQDGPPVTPGFYWVTEQEGDPVAPFFFRLVEGGA